MLKLIGIKTNKGYYICNISSIQRYGNTFEYRVNGEEVDKTFNDKWYFIKNEPREITKLSPPSSTNHRYVLKDKSLSDKFKETYTKDEAENGVDSDYDTIYKEGFIRELYDYVYDTTPGEWLPIEFEYETIQEIEEFIEPTGLSYKRLGDYNKTISPITSKDIQYDMIQQIITPEILLSNGPCKLSSQNSFDIVRAYVKDNINPLYAEISSDYSFCFQVNKKIKLAQNEPYIVDVGTKRKPKNETRYRISRAIKTFEMTYSPKNYQGYTPIKGFEGKNEEDLKQNIDSYLENLINEINEPLQDCECCLGLGVILKQENK